MVQCVRDATGPTEDIRWDTSDLNVGGCDIERTARLGAAANRAPVTYDDEIA